jgi:hypothetical protein
MKKIEITETDLAYRKGLAEILVNSHDAVAFVFEVPDDFDLDQYEGISEFKGAPIQEVNNFNVKFPEVVAWLESYKGTFDFYRSLQAQFKAKGMLSEKQIACVQRAIESDKCAGVVAPTLSAKKEYNLKQGTVLVISKFMSNKISKQAGHDRAHRAVEIVEVEGETPKAWRARVRLSARRTSHCGVCGLFLENPHSLAAGIGPICASNNGIPYGENSLEQLNKILDTTVEVTTWIPKSCIKEEIRPDGTVISSKAKDPEEDSGLEMKNKFDLRPKRDFIQEQKAFESDRFNDETDR